jgi:hypothetical protein
MTRDEVTNLMRWDGTEPPTVTIARCGAEWTGQVIGLVTQPALILRDGSGQRRVIVLDGAALASRDSQAQGEDT